MRQKKIKQIDSYILTKGQWEGCPSGWIDGESGGIGRCGSCGGGGDS